MLWICKKCTTKYAVGLEQCPQCGSPDYVEQGEEMAKINSGPQGATDKTNPDLTVAEQIAINRGEDLEEFRKDNPELTKQQDNDKNEEGDTSSDGNNSSTSTDKREKTEQKNSDKDQSPALTTDSPFGKAQTEFSSASSTDGNTKDSKSGKK